MVLRMTVTIVLKGRSSCCCVTAPGLWRRTLEMQGSAPLLLSWPLLPRLPLLLSSISPHLTSPPSPTFVLLFFSVPTGSRQCKDIHVPSSDVLTCTASFSVGGLEYKRLVLLIYACCLYACVCVWTTTCECLCSLRRE